MQRLKISDNKRFLVLEDGAPFFWLADTVWEIFHRFSIEDAKEYFEVRKRQGFNVIQAVVLAEMDGLQSPNVYGRVPLLKNSKGEYDPTMLDLSGDYSYFDHVDRIIQMAEESGIYVALLPTWGDKWNLKWGVGPEVFSEENAFEYGRLIGERYKNKDNIVWVLGGDRPYEEPHHEVIVRNMAKGIKAGGATQIMTFHPMGHKSSSEYVNNEDWLDFNMIQSGHGEPITKNYKMIEHDYNLHPVKPVVEAECNYEDHGIAHHPENGYFDDTDVRRASYFAVFSGSFGITYGNHSVWPAHRRGITYNEGGKKAEPYYFLTNALDALESPGANQMKYLKELIESKSFLDRVPCDEIIIQNYEGAQHQVATKGENYILVYCACGLPCLLDLSHVQSYTAKWLNPRTGEYTDIGSFNGSKAAKFSPPDIGRNCDYVLVIEF